MIKSKTKKSKPSKRQANRVTNDQKALKRYEEIEKKISSFAPQKIHQVTLAEESWTTLSIKNNCS